MNASHASSRPMEYLTISLCDENATARAREESKDRILSFITLAEKQPQSLMYLFMEMRSVLLTISKKELIVNVGGISVEK